MKECTLEGNELDMAVALADGLTICGEGKDAYFVRACEERKDGFFVPLAVPVTEYRPSVDWSLAGPIIDRERICLAHTGDGMWEAGAVCEYGYEGPECKFLGYGQTALVAAMRVFVASREQVLPTVPPQKEVGMRIGGRYNWKSQPERLVYLGRNWSGNGYWHQFAKVDAPTVVWCEVLDSDLLMLEETAPAVAGPVDPLVP